MTFAVPVIGDTLYEGQERFLVTLSNGVNGTVSDDEYGAYGVITDDDPAPAVSVSDPVVVEGDSGTTPATFTVSLDRTSGLDTIVEYATVDGTASSPDDYTAAAATVTVPAGSISATVSVDVVGDTLFEGDETFTLAISNPTNADLGIATAPATIFDDDPAPELLAPRSREARVCAASRWSRVWASGLVRCSFRRAR